MSLSTNTEALSTNILSIKKLQDFCSSLFVAAFAIHILFYSLLLCGIDLHIRWFSFTSGVIAFAGYVIMRYLSSDITAELFAIGQIGVELFFFIALPLLLPQLANDPHIYMLIFYMCAGFLVLGVYLWSILLANNRFGRNIWWLLLQPICYFVKIYQYEIYLTDVLNIELLRPLIEVDATAFQAGVCLLSIYRMIGYWKLIHSQCFNRSQDTSWGHTISPFNLYTISYFILVGLIFWLF